MSSLLKILENLFSKIEVMERRQQSTLDAIQELKESLERIPPSLGQDSNPYDNLETNSPPPHSTEQPLQDFRDFFEENLPPNSSSAPSFPRAPYYSAAYYPPAPTSIQERLADIVSTQDHTFLTRTEPQEDDATLANKDCKSPVELKTPIAPGKKELTPLRVYDEETD